MIMKDAADRLRHRMDCAGRAQGGGHFGIGAGFAARNRARELVDALVRGNEGHVEATSASSLWRPLSSAPMPSMAISAFAAGAARGFGVEPEQPAAGVDLAGFGKLDANDAKRAPCNTASADRRVKNRVPIPDIYATTPEAS